MYRDNVLYGNTGAALASDRGFVIAGHACAHIVSGLDLVLIKADANGDSLWTRRYGGLHPDYGFSVQACPDGGYIIAGDTYSSGAGQSDIFLVKTDMSGEAIWSKTFGGSGLDGARFVQSTSDGGFIIAGQTRSYGLGEYDVYILKVADDLVAPELAIGVLQNPYMTQYLDICLVASEELDPTSVEFEVNTQPVSPHLIDPPGGSDPAGAIRWLVLLGPAGRTPSGYHIGPDLMHDRQLAHVEFSYDEPELTAEELTAEGWVKFEAGDYGGALSRFEQAIGKDSEFGEAYNGAGWCCIGLDSLARALDRFGAALSNGVASGDPCAGKAVVYRDLEPAELEAAISWADSALSIDSQYVFSHDTDFDWHDLRLIIAQSYFELARYDDAKAEVDILNPANTLDPASATFVEDLLAELQRLGEEF